MQQGRGRIVRKVALLLAAVALVLGGLSIGQATAQATGGGAIALNLFASFDGSWHSGVVAGTISPPLFSGSAQATTSVLPFTFSAVCADTSPCPSARATYYFGDGTTQSVPSSASSLAVTHIYTSPGVYHATVRVVSSAGAGATYITVYVAPRYAGADASLPNAPGLVHRQAIWIGEALGWSSACRVALNASAVPRSSDIGRGLACAAPLATWGPPAGSAMPAGATANGVTGVNCMTVWYACGLPAATFAASTGNPLSACDASCQATLENQTPPLLIAPTTAGASPTLAFDPLNCGDGWAATPSSGSSWSIAPGTEAGCVSRAAFFQALVRTFDGHSSLPGALASPASMCVDTATPAMERTNALGIPTTVPTTGSTTTASCYAQTGITKEQAYVALAAVAGLPAPSTCPNVLADLVDETLGNGTATPDPNCGAIWSLLKAGVPLVGSSACPSGTRVCFNGGQALTTMQMDRLFGGLLLGTDHHGSAVSVHLAPAVTPAVIGQADTLTATVKVPVTDAVGSSVTLSWPQAGGQATTTCPTSTTLTVPSSRVMTAQCTYTIAAAQTSALTATATDSVGTTGEGVLALPASNTAPTFGTPPTISCTSDDTNCVAVIPVTAPNGGALSYQVAGFQSDMPDPGIFPLTGLLANAALTGSTFVADGKVLVAKASTGAQVTWIHPTVTSGALASSVDPESASSYGFALRACAQGAGCSTTYINGQIGVSTDAPEVAASSGVNTTGTSTISFPLQARDPVSVYTITSLPATGTLLIDTGGGTYAPATVGATTTDPTVEYTPSASGTTASFTWTATASATGSVSASSTMNITVN